MTAEIVITHEEHLECEIYQVYKGSPEDNYKTPQNNPVHYINRWQAIRKARQMASEEGLKVRDETSYNFIEPEPMEDA